MKSLALACMSLAAISAQESNKVQSDPVNALVTPSTIIALSETANFIPSADRALDLDPGIRMTWSDAKLALTTFDGRNIVLHDGNDSFVLASGSLICPTDRGWDLGNGKISQTSRLHARRQAQDDADSNLKSMQEAAKKLNGKAPQPARKLRFRWQYAENAFATAELFNTAAIQQLNHISPAGF